MASSGRLIAVGVVKGFFLRRPGNLESAAVLDRPLNYFNYRCIMESFEATQAFEALSHETRLAVLRMLIPSGRDGLSAGAIGERLGLPANSLSFHLGRLVNAGIIYSRRQGRHLYYAVDYARLADLVGFLADDCCAAAPEGCLPECPGVAAPDSGGCEPLKSTTRKRR